MGKSIVIIGAGIAGLSAGCYGRMNGYDTRVFELHDKPGGLCTAWKRKDYTVDGCIHWLVGTNPSSNFNRIWRELGALQGKEVVNHEVFIRFEGTGGRFFDLYTDVDRLERHMKELAPADTAIIEEMTGAIRAIGRVDMPLPKPREVSSPFDGLKMLPKMLPLMRPLMKYRKISLRAFAERFTDPLLHEAFTGIFDLPDFPLLAFLFTMAWLNNRDAGYPVGGSLEFSRAIEGRYLDLGGEISYSSAVEKILVEGGRAVGIRLSDGSEHRADIVISAADGHATIFDMLEGKYADDKIHRRYDSMPIFEPLVQVALGVASELRDEPQTVSFPLPSPIEIAGQKHERMQVINHRFDPVQMPEGKTVLITTFMTEYLYWEKLYDDRDRYKEEKKSIADAVVTAIEGRFPAVTGRIEMVDVATPITYKRYTNNWQGSFEGWLLTTTNMGESMIKGMDMTLPGLEGFYMIGQWVKPGGGLPPAAQSGREVIQIICHKDGRPFTTTE
ncbi:MAG: NAD(P)/FAD-dependent oxidoreductase [Actinobacteria bacterium]|jgi:phytoene dehydrogenase-like protein|nr:MAG: NAD(P)/FAD-dependent oxidoreductase [Actinomycetota bacterium]